jgi:hypothetical protein
MPAESRPYVPAPVEDNRQSSGAVGWATATDRKPLARSARINRFRRDGGLIGLGRFAPPRVGVGLVVVGVAHILARGIPLGATIDVTSSHGTTVA